MQRFVFPGILYIFPSVVFLLLLFYLFSSHAHMLYFLPLCHIRIFHFHNYVLFYQVVLHSYYILSNGLFHPFLLLYLYVYIHNHRRYIFHSQKYGLQCFAFLGILYISPSVVFLLLLFCLFSIHAHMLCFVLQHYILYIYLFHHKYVLQIVLFDIYYMFLYVFHHYYQSSLQNHVLVLFLVLFDICYISQVLYMLLPANYVLMLFLLLLDIFHMFLLLCMLLLANHVLTLFLALFDICYI